MFAEFLEVCRARYGMGDTSTSMAEWLTMNTTLRKQPFSFARFPFQRQIADDMHPNMSVEKCSQVGLSEVQIRKFFAILTRNESINGIFTLPNEKMYKRIYSGRMAPILQTDAIFNPETGATPVRRNDLVQIRDSFGYITGCSESDATSIAADFLFHDEVDLSPQEILALFPSRLQGSSMGVTQSFSTPSFVSFGINRAYAASDQHEYLCRCHSCNHWNLPVLEFRFLRIPDLPTDLAKIDDLTPEQIAMLRLDRATVVCEKCQSELDLGGTSNREWVAKYPGRVNNRGYKVRPFSTGRLGVGHVLGRLARAKTEENIRGFYNTVLGDPFTESSARISEAQVKAVMTETASTPDTGNGACFVGVDIGQICHIVVLQEPAQFVHFDTCHISQLDDRLAEIARRFAVVQGCADRFPYTPTVDALRDSTGGLFMPVQYRGAATIGRVRDELGNITHYSANRTVALDRVKTAIVDKVAVITGYGPHRETIVTHLGDMVRDERPEQEPEWKKLHGNDHFFHAMALALLAPRVGADSFTHAPSLGPSSVTMNVVTGSNNGPLPFPKGKGQQNRSLFNGLA